MSMNKVCANCAYHSNSNIYSDKCICRIKQTYVSKKHICKRFKWSVIPYAREQVRVNDELIKRLDRMERKLDKIWEKVSAKPWYN